MSKYYGVSTPTDDFLAHYGVKGMKWGIRRALRSGNPEKLRKQYMKAAKKLGDLSLRANNKLNEEKYRKWRSNAKKSAIGGGVGAAAGNFGGTLLGLARNGYGIGDVIRTPGATSILGLSTLQAGAAGALGGYTGGRIRAHMYKRRQKPDVRKQLLYERDQWRRDMEDAFKGTAYGGKPQKQFHKEISRLSDVSNPVSYMQSQKRKADNQLRKYQKKHK